ncbi:50S ribosomal protein L31 [Candidatus Marinamargulisbacteria bacterium SCGC AG-439-L15]|nr:50S ribosomal protein L31 [Candidatus Marinamargulisbacteria bacterium SCGC AG-439-L15]
MAKQKIDIANENITYHSNIEISCVCGATFEAGSTLESIRVDICAMCHPFYTGDTRIIDAEGRVEKFKKKYNM